MIFRIRPSEAERLAGELDSATLNPAVQRFRRDGALILDDIVDTRLIEQGRKAFLEQYTSYLNGGRVDERLKVGDQRLMITVRMESPFDDQRLFANSLLDSVLSNVLDEKYVIDSFGVVCSLPGAQAQQAHRDGGVLFPEIGIDRLFPTVAVTVGMPMLEMNDVNGTTELWLGSHRNLDELADAEGIKPIVPEGSCVLWDYRLLHSGTENRSSVPRPLLYLTYARPWFIDAGNYGEINPKQRRIIASPDQIPGLSKLGRRVLARARWNY